MLQTFTCQPGFNCTIQNTTLLTRCMRKLLDVNSHRLFPAKVYFLMKWTDKTDRIIVRPLCLHACGSVRVLFHTAYCLPRRKHARAIVILIRVSCHLFSGKRQISGAVSNRLPITLL